MKNVVDSNGNVFDTSQLKNAFKIKKYEARIEELKQIQNRLLPLMSEKNIPCDENSFYLMVQPMYKEERILFFTKIPLWKESHLVKQSIETMNHSHYQFENEKQEEQIKSIMYSEDNQFWLIHAEMLILERNLFDCQYISIRQSPPIPIYHFLKQVPAMMTENNQVTTQPNDYRYCFSPALPTEIEKDMILEHAMIRDAISSKENSAEFDKRLFYVIYDMTKELEIVKDSADGDGRDAYSNLETLYLYYINECSPLLKDGYHIYEKIKHIISEIYPNAYGISYDSHPYLVVFTVEENQKEKVIIYLIQENTFIMGGRLYTDIDSLKTAIQERKFQEPRWFTDKVSPYIENHSKGKLS